MTPWWSTHDAAYWYVESRSFIGPHYYPRNPPGPEAFVQSLLLNLPLSHRIPLSCPLIVQTPQALTAAPSTVRPAITFIDPSLFTHRRVRISSLPGLPFSGAHGRVLTFWPPTSAEAQSLALVPYGHLAASFSRAIVCDDAMVVYTRRRLLVRRIPQLYRSTLLPP
jgi:hypothetical protein